MIKRFCWINGLQNALIVGSVNEQLVVTLLTGRLLIDPLANVLLVMRLLVFIVIFKSI